MKRAGFHPCFVHSDSVVEPEGRSVSEREPWWWGWGAGCQVWVTPGDTAQLVSVRHPNKIL